MVDFAMRTWWPALLLAACSTANNPAPAQAPPGEDGHHAHEGESHDHQGAHGQQGAHHGAEHHGHHRFEDADAWAEKFDDPARDAYQRPEAVIDFIDPDPGAVIADLGAGTGYFAMRLARRVPKGRVLANDIEPDMIRYLGERAEREALTNVVPVLGEATNPALPQPVDIAFMCNVYHHIGDRPAFFTHLVQQLQPGGRLIIVELRKDASDDVPGPPPAMRIAQSVLVRELSAIGLEVVRADRELLPHHYVVELVAAH